MVDIATARRHRKSVAYAVAIMRLVESAIEVPARRALVEDLVVACQYASESEAIDLILPTHDDVIGSILGGLDTVYKPW